MCCYGNISQCDGMGTGLPSGSRQRPHLVPTLGAVGGVPPTPKTQVAVGFLALPELGVCLVECGCGLVAGITLYKEEVWCMGGVTTPLNSPHMWSRHDLACLCLTWDHQF